MTSRTFMPQYVSKRATSSGPHRGGSHRQPSSGVTKSAANQEPPRAQTPILTVQRLTVTEYLSVMPRSGDKPLRRVTETQARSLLALALVEPICKSRRGEIIALRIRVGIPVADINRALRQGAGNMLPIAEDNRTVRRSPAEHGGGIYYEFVRTEAWDDGRE